MSTLKAVRDPGRSEIERRLEQLGRPKIAVFALREALRAAPLLAIVGPERAADVATPCFRAILTACVAAADAQREREAVAAADAAFAAANAAFSAASVSGVVHSALYAAARAAAAAVAPSASAAAYSGFGAAYCSARAAAAHTLILDEARRDLERLEGAFTAERLRAAPLWPFGAPAAFDEAVDRLAEALARGAMQPPVWVDWYGAKLGGWPALTLWEREWAAAPQALWEAQPSVLAETFAEIRLRRGEEAGPGAAERGA